jgi:hypothetical protein
MIVRTCDKVLHSYVLILLSGELLEKSTRVLTEQDKALLDQEWAGRDGSKRKLEVWNTNVVSAARSTDGNKLDVAHYGSTKAQEDIPVRDQMEGPRSPLQHMGPAGRAPAKGLPEACTAI